MSNKPLELLTDVYQEWCKSVQTMSEPDMSADELLHELYHRKAVIEENIEWLEAFMKLWKETEHV